MYTQSLFYTPLFYDFLLYVSCKFTSPLNFRSVIFGLT